MLGWWVGMKGSEERDEIGLGLESELRGHPGLRSTSHEWP